MQSNYKLINNVLGWTVFAIATITYVLTLEPTASFWDCGEYISTSVKLQVGHPPGAPFFQLIGNVLAQLTTDNTQQAYMVNLASAFSSSFTILFLFWTITAFAKKLIGSKDSLSTADMIAIFGSGVVGSLAYTFSDSFWFSAVEGEVYAMSSFFTAIAFWAILKWEAVADTDPYANRWLVLIAYLVGLSVGVHILVFLAIPAICMVYYYKKYKEVNTRGFVIANVASIGVLGLVFSLIIPLILNLFGWLEIFSVNNIGLPKNSGTILAFLVLAAGTFYGIQFARKTGRPLLQHAILAIVFLMIGYSSFIMLAVRSNANTPIDENNPEDALSMLAYYKREQYGDWPILYGQSFNAQYDGAVPFVDGKPTYTYNDETGKYVITNDGRKSVPNYDKKYMGFFPRMWSDQPDHVKNYQAITGVNPKSKIKFMDHFRFFMNYQVGQMYWRYFMWNFSGRQNDEQNRYEITKGNWITGIDAIDAIRLGPQSNLPDHMKNNPARNTYFALPFILGLLGLYYQIRKDGKNAWVVTLFFLFTGLAIVVYTNHKPFEPRERDYAFVGSFYVYAIWIGLGVMALYDWLGKFRNTSTITAVSVIALFAVPIRMAAENWDDHDRSNRYTARDIAKAYLDSCEPNAILFTNGDNDTFPLWYVQEVEGYRTDVRIVNLSLLNTDWYIDQMKRKTYDGEPVPISFTKDQYVQGTRDVLYFQDRGISGRWDIHDFINWTKRDDKATKFIAMKDKELPFYPVKKLRVNIDKEQVLKHGVVDAADSANIVDYIDWNLEQNAISKRDLMVIDMIANNDWSRPIYFSITVGSRPKDYFFLDQYFRLEGLAYRFVPVEKKQPNQGMDYGTVDTKRMYNNLMNKFQFGNMELPDVYLDETNRRSSANLRSIYGRLADKLAQEGDREKAVEVLDYAMSKMPVEKFGYNYFLLGMIESYYKAGAADKADALVNGFADMLESELKYYEQFKGTTFSNDAVEFVNEDLQYFQMLVRLSAQYKTNGSMNQSAVEGLDIYNRFMEASKSYR